MLFAVIFSAIGQIFSKSYVTLGLQMIYYAACLVNPCFCLAVPMIAYDTIRYKYYPLLFTIPISIACNFENLGGQIFPLIGCLLCCVTLSLRTIQTDKLHKELISTRDDSEELTMELVQKNKSFAVNRITRYTSPPSRSATVSPERFTTTSAICSHALSSSLALLLL